MVCTLHPTVSTVTQVLQLSFSEIPAKLENLADLPNISTNHSQTEKKTKCMHPKQSTILVLTMVLAA